MSVSGRTSSDTYRYMLKTRMHPGFPGSFDISPYSGLATSPPAGENGQDESSAIESARLWGESIPPVRHDTTSPVRAARGLS